jgi:hypothetical protein
MVVTLLNSLASKTDREINNDQWSCFPPIHEPIIYPHGEQDPDSLASKAWIADVAAGRGHLPVANSRMASAGPVRGRHDCRPLWPRQTPQAVT